jgi:pimeloyl-ACP methyl ester carboxylesterase
VQNEFSVSYGELKLSYVKYGEGEQIIICFHGHGRSPDDYKFLEKENRTIISIVLFHHGSSYFPEKRIEHNPLTSLEFLVCFRAILSKEKIDFFDVVAFSQGGRFALIVFENYYNQIGSFNLISPDGMDSNSFYNRMSRKKWARMLFRHWESNPKRIIHYARVAKVMKLMRPKVASFVEKFAEDHISFKRASHTWRGFREIRPNEVKLKTILKIFEGNFQIVMGSYDQVIRPQQAYAFAKRIEKPECVLEIPCGHNFFSEKNIELLRKVICF